MFLLWPDLKEDIEKLLSYWGQGTHKAMFFGYRISPISGARQWHNATDIPKANGTPICLPWDGYIVNAWFDPKVRDGGHGGGNSIVIRHPTRDVPYHSTGYCHLEKFSLETLQNMEKVLAANTQPTLLRAGTVIGWTDSTGDSTGGHLHFVLRQRIAGEVECIDPLPVLVEAVGLPGIPGHSIG